MPDPRTYQFNLPSNSAPTNVKLDEEWYPGIIPYAISASTRRTVDAITGIRAIVIHATAGASSEGAVSVIKSRSASFHWLVPDENEAAHAKNVWATCHEARRAWHVRNTASHPDVYFGEQGVNDYSLGIEIVNMVASSDRYSDWQVAATAQIVRYCWEKYPNLKYIVSHAKLDPTRRTDPGAHFPWDKFRETVLDSPESPGEAMVAGLARNAREIREQVIFDD
ncbi:N-acetylmuramoyl-L-alanine amidase [Aminobacter sp. AP02]|uniref:N-acetylmuramoyl-L-alanine amidase n=1 Tax=Aminobacter sp. AP02 TaxID=2135737 RepID=UPI000D6A9761|nr:N-acetylmuramoyl-L-alanine amidase [Aminobacter sp. AP02]PWK75562.1 N-acetylmuramoyl-L-alanine amidase [Aminobacter sp. AP02]